jgi:hypothetical protein
MLSAFLAGLKFIGTKLAAAGATAAATAPGAAAAGATVAPVAAKAGLGTILKQVGVDAAKRIATGGLTQEALKAIMPGPTPQTSVQQAPQIRRSNLRNALEKWGVR